MAPRTPMAQDPLARSKNPRGPSCVPAPARGRAPVRPGPRRGRAPLTQQGVVQYRPGLGGRGVGRGIAHRQQRVLGLGRLRAGSGREPGPACGADGAERGCVPGRELARRVHRARALRVRAGIRGPGRVRPALRCGKPRRSTTIRGTPMRCGRACSRIPPGSPDPGAGPGGARRSRVTGERPRARPGPSGRWRGRTQHPRPDHVPAARSRAPAPVAEDRADCLPFPRQAPGSPGRAREPHPGGPGRRGPHPGTGPARGRPG